MHSLDKKRQASKKTPAPVAKLVDAPDLGSGVERRVGSSPIRRTIIKSKKSFYEVNPFWGSLHFLSHHFAGEPILIWLSSKKVWALTIYDTKHSCFRILGVICRLFSHWKYIFDVLCRAKNQTPGTRVKSVARFFVHVAQRRTLSRTSLAVFIFLTFAGCCGIKCNLIDNACSN